MSNTEIGVIIAITPTQEIPKKDGGTFKKRDLVLQVTRRGRERDFITTPKFEFMGERCTELDAWQVGQQVKVTFELEGREYNGQYYNTVRAFRVEAVAQPTVVNPAPQPTATPLPPINYITPPVAQTPPPPKTDDLPF
jgi:hypothetical protein